MTTIKALTLRTASLLVVFILLLTTACRRSPSDSISGDAALHAPSADTIDRLVMQINRQARLYTSECKVHKVVLCADDKVLEGSLLGRSIDVSHLLGERKVAIPIDVSLKAYVDFSDFGADALLFGPDSTVLLTLPDPAITVTASHIDHKGVRQYVAFARSNFSEADINRFAQQGVDSITAHLDRYGITERARMSCARQIVPIFTAMGYDEHKVSIRFRKDFTPSDLQSLIQIKDGKKD